MILITGGAGYIGSVLVSRLRRDGKKIRIFDNLMYTGEGLLANIGSPYVDFYQGDMRNPEDCINALKGIDTVIHLAAIVGEAACKKNPSMAKDVNFYATCQLWEMARDQGTRRFFFASTCSNYGVADLASEKTELKPLGLYAETKVDAERWLLAQDSGDMDTVIFRFATAFGVSPRTRWDLLINEFVLDAYISGRLSIYNPAAQRPYCHVEDIANMVSEVVQMVRRFVGFNKTIFNVGGYNRSKFQIAEILKREFPSLLVDISQGGDGRNYRVDFSKIHAYGITPVRPPETEIKKMIVALPLFDNLRAKKWRNA